MKRANKDPTWYNITPMTPEEFGELLLMVVETTYFRFYGKIFEQAYGSMGHHYPRAYPTASWKNLKIRHWQTNPTKFWDKYVDDTGVGVKQIHEDELFQHINRQYPSIKFTIEKEDEEQSLPMLDLKLKRESNSITTDIYVENLPTIPSNRK